MAMGSPMQTSFVVENRFYGLSVTLKGVMTRAAASNLSPTRCPGWGSLVYKGGRPWQPAKSQLYMHFISVYLSSQSCLDVGRYPVFGAFVLMPPLRLPIRSVI